MITRQSNQNDLEELSRLFDNYRVFYERESDVNGAKHFLGERMQNNESKIYVVENEKGELTGFVQLYPVFSSVRMKRLWLLNDLFVAEEWRGQGFSVLLIDEAKKLCKETNACGLMLETAKSNVEGNNLYRKTGFSLDLDHNYYSWDID